MDDGGELHILNSTLLNNTLPNGTKEKVLYAPSVYLTELEYLALVKKFQEKDTLKKIDALSMYKQSSGRKYKSDYFTILNWARKDDEKKDEVVMPKKRFEPGVPDDYDARLKAHVDKIHREQEAKK